jgi:hypothetical protein
MTEETRQMKRPQRTGDIVQSSRSNEQKIKKEKKEKTYKGAETIRIQHRDKVSGAQKKT